ncbi:MAG TPA: methyltransferase domain-containing protein [Solirubrobacterales bacterium]|nr:methyltransferase domain-containing protein [Solirubrobacterales bacterium]
MESGQQTTKAPAEGLDELRAGLHTMWGAVAPGWEQNADFVDSRTEDLTRAMLEAAALEPGDRVLELACGPGGLGIAAADRVGADGEVVLSDVTPQMTAIAAARSEARGLGNVTTLDLDLERLDQPDGSYDAVLCREGIMLVPDHDGAASEMRRVLRLGGRAVVSVWGPRERNPWLGAMLDAVGTQLGVTFPPPGLPGPFALDGRDKLLAVLSGAGFEDVAVDEVEAPWIGASFDQWWLVTTALAGPLAKVLEAQPPEAIDAIRSRAREALAPYETPNGLEIPGVTLVGAARRA